MPKDYPRTVRVAEQIHRELAELLRKTIRDPRIGTITIMDVEVSPDLAHARVYYSVLEDSTDLEACEAGLKHAAGYLRRLLSKRLHLRTVPELRFMYDDTQHRGARIQSLIEQALAGDDDATADDRDRH